MTQRRVRIGCDFTYLAEVSTPVIFQVRPGGSAGLALDAEQWSSQPLMAIRSYTDVYGNPCTRAALPPGGHASDTMPWPPCRTRPRTLTRRHR